MNVFHPGDLVRIKWGLGLDLDDGVESYATVLSVDCLSMPELISIYVKGQIHKFYSDQLEIVSHI